MISNYPPGTQIWVRSCEHLCDLLYTIPETGVPFADLPPGYLPP